MSDANPPADGDPFVPPPTGGTEGVAPTPTDVPPTTGTPQAAPSYSSPPPPPPPPPAPAYGSAQPPAPAYGSAPPYGIPQPGAAAPGAYGYGPPKTAGRAVAVMVLGIVGLVLLCGYGVGIVPAIVALALAPGAKREIAASQGALTGEGMVKAGVICAWIAVGLAIAIIAIIIIAAVGGAFSSSSNRF